VSVTSLLPQAIEIQVRLSHYNGTRVMDAILVIYYWGDNSQYKAEVLQ